MPVDFHQEPLSVRQMTVLHIVALRGDGTPASPVRQVQYFYSTTGEMLACVDPLNGPVDHFCQPGLCPNARPQSASPALAHALQAG